MHQFLIWNLGNYEFFEHILEKIAKLGKNDFNSCFSFQYDDWYWHAKRKITQVYDMCS